MLQTLVHPTPESSNIEELVYLQNRTILLVSFKNGRTYAYKNVPLSVYEELLNDEGVGSGFFKRIKPHYDFLQVA